MKKAYEKPVALANEEFMEGVYMASGAGASGDGDCYTITARIHQKPETGREDYRIQVDAHHDAKHHSGEQRFIISFNQPVHFSFCNAQGAHVISGDGTSTLEIGLTYHNNFTENIGFGDLVVTSEAGLAITDVKMTYCNKDCGQH